jgi:hypothetical protein
LPRGRYILTVSTGHGRHLRVLLQHVLTMR